MHESIMGNYLRRIFEFTEGKSTHARNETDASNAAVPSKILLGTESKLFWRTQNTFIVDFYFYECANCIETVIQNTHIRGHCRSIFFDHALLKSNLHRTRGATRTLEAFHSALIAFVMERLQQDSMGEIGYYPLSSDPEGSNPILASPPSKVVPGSEKKIRLFHSSSHEIDEAMSGLCGETVRLRVATSQARKYSEQTTKAIKKLEGTPIRQEKPDLVKHVSSGEFSPTFDKMGKRGSGQSEKGRIEWNSPLSLRRNKLFSSGEFSV